MSYPKRAGRNVERTWRDCSMGLATVAPAGRGACCRIADRTGACMPLGLTSMAGAATEVRG